MAERVLSNGDIFNDNPLNFSIRFIFSDFIVCVGVSACLGVSHALITVRLKYVC